jgi:hypothetical protein
MEPTHTPVENFNLVAAIVSIVTTIVFFLITWLKDGRARRWQLEDLERKRQEDKAEAEKARATVARDLHDRLEAEALERLMEARKVQVKIDEAHKDLVARVDENTKVSLDAFAEANGHNRKLVSLTESVAAVPAVAAAAAAVAVKAIEQAKTQKIENPPPS